MQKCKTCERALDKFGRLFPRPNGKFAFPGGHVDYGEKLEEACLRELKEECNLDGTIKKLIDVHGDPLRDPRKHYISAFYEVDVENINELNAGDDASDASFVNVEDIYDKPDLFAFQDHNDVIKEILKTTNKNL